MYLAFVSLIAGIFTAFTPCVLPILPVMLAGEVGDRKDTYKVFRIILSLCISIIVCTLLLKYSTIFIGISPTHLRVFSGVIIILVAIAIFFPYAWAAIITKLTIRNTVQRLSGKLFMQTVPRYRDYVLGATLGPIFSSCSPTYFVIVATVLPSNLTQGIIYLIIYCVGLAFSLYIISIFGESLIRYLNSNTIMEKITTKSIALVLFITGILIIFGYDSYIEQQVPTSATLSKIEGTLLETVNKSPAMSSQEVPKEIPAATSQAQRESGTSNNKALIPVVSNVKPVLQSVINTTNGMTFTPELSGISGYLNTHEKITIADALSKNKVVVVFFWTFGCINCKRALPSLNDLYAKYHDKGLEVIGIHTPEFAYERVEKNVQDAMKKLGVKFPVVLDNDYSTWKSFDNNYWPRKYIIVPTGEIIYEHAGEGAYSEIETIVANIVNK